MEGLSERVAAVRAELGPGVALVAVTKGFGPEVVAAAVGAGAADVGENYAQELAAKAEALGPGDGPGPRWHFLGQVQRNKVKALAPLVHLWQSVDRRGAGEEIARRAPGARVLVQVNLSGLPRRLGCAWEEAPALVEALAGLGLDVRGLMGVAGGDGGPRAQFRRLAGLAQDLGLHEVSMGMSGDWRVAVEEGSTMVRLGTALFGPRPEPGHLRR